MSRGNIALRRRAVIFTALPVEFNAVRAHLTDLHEEVYKGTVYETGIFSANGQMWDVGIVEVGAGNDTAAFEAERAITHFDPSVTLFVGIAGGIKDVKVGDVVAATKVYGYESGKAEKAFKSRPDVGNSSYGMVQRARAEARRQDWLERIIGVIPDRLLHAFVGPIAAGEKVVAATKSNLFQFLKSTYNDTLAVEMEGRGFLEATHANPRVMALIVRGISDLINNKSDLDDSARQEIASRHASAFAFEVLAKLEGSVTITEADIDDINVMESSQFSGTGLPSGFDEKAPAGTETKVHYQQALNPGGEPAPDPQKKLRVTLLYKRHAQPDEYVLGILEEHLHTDCEIFIDRHMSIGIEWAREIEQQIRTADAVVPLLSASSVQSEMLAHEMEIANESAQQTGKPRILPVRICYQEPLPESLGAILNQLQYAYWAGTQDDQYLRLSIIKALRTPQRLAPKKLEAEGGAVPLDSDFYIVRPTDQEFMDAIKRGDSIVLVKGARQMGKTSLLARGLHLSRSMGARIVLTDLQKLNAEHLSSTQMLFQTLGSSIADQLDLDCYPEDVWSARRGPSMNFERYLRREVLGKINGPLVWCLDEVDRLFASSFASEVFGLFRSWHNERSLDPGAPWQRLTMAMAYATEAHLFITDLNQSPFNVGTRLTLKDFELGQVANLNQRYGEPLRDSSELNLFYNLLNGHPYLVRRGLNEMVSQALPFADFAQQAGLDDGPFGDHLRRFLVILAQDAALCDVMRKLIQGRAQLNSKDFYRLRSAGLISGHTTQDARLRCQLYVDYFKRHLL